ncbi:lipid-A-disaccharide synthase N-terminal domain-containing protein [Patescibacteria group bacterium]|nr:lipid-A-disaccharide synthase N-terminal domain-containing protein [Patescibacteria group bacterium]
MLQGIGGFHVDGWTFWGWLAQGLFFLSFVIQWYLSEKKKRSFLPVEFWWIRIAGSAMLIFYVFHTKDMVFLVSTVLQLLMYARNIFLTVSRERKT